VHDYVLQYTDPESNDNLAELGWRDGGKAPHARGVLSACTVDPDHFIRTIIPNLTAGAPLAV